MKALIEETSYVSNYQLMFTQWNKCLLSVKIRNPAIEMCASVRVSQLNLQHNHRAWVT